MSRLLFLVLSFGASVHYRIPRPQAPAAGAHMQFPGPAAVAAPRVGVPERLDHRFHRRHRHQERGALLFSSRWRSVRPSRRATGLKSLEDVILFA